MGANTALLCSREANSWCTRVEEVGKQEVPAGAAWQEQRLPM